MPSHVSPAFMTDRERHRVRRGYESDSVFQAYRLLFLVSAALILGFWIAYRIEVPEAVDPLWLRAAITGAALAVWALTYTSDWVRRHFVALGRGYVCLLTLWWIVMVGLNRFEPSYTVGFIFVLTAGAIALSHSLDHTAWLTAYFGTTLALTAATMTLVPEPVVGHLVFAGCVLGIAAVLLVTLHSRTRVFHALKSSEAQLAEAHRIARLGNWEWDPRTGALWCSDEAARLFGLPNVTTFDALLAVLDEADRARLAAWAADLRTGTFPKYLRLPQPDGSVRYLHCWASVERDERGEPCGVHGASQDVSEEKRYEAALIVAKEEAERVARLKSAILENMSHELRTPLTGIIGFAEALGEADAEERAVIARVLLRGSQRLLGTLDLVLDLAWLEAGEAEPTPEPLDATTLLHQVAEPFRLQAVEKGLTLEVEPPPEPLPLVADRHALTRALGLLTDNGVKFTDEGTVTLSAQRVAGGVSFRVTDTGPGIREEFLPYLFDPFEQESVGWGRRYEGCGLGLAVAGQLVELLGGTIRVRSELGRGSTFEVVVPSGASRPRPEAARTERPKRNGAPPAVASGLPTAPPALSP